MSGFVPLQLEVAGWGLLRFLRVLPRREDSWGCLSGFRGTPWETVVSVVAGEDLSHALHGHPWPLLKSLGPSPESLCRNLPPELGCAYLLDKTCPTRNVKKCHPGLSLPNCYQAVSLEEVDTGVVFEVALALSEGRYIIITEGKTFSL